MVTGKALNGKPYTGNPHMRFAEGKFSPGTAEASLRRVHCRRQPEGRASVCAVTPRRGSLLYKWRRRLNVVRFGIMILMLASCLQREAQGVVAAKQLTSFCGFRRGEIKRGNMGVDSATRARTPFRNLRYVRLEYSPKGRLQNVFAMMPRTKMKSDKGRREFDLCCAELEKYGISFQDRRIEKDGASQSLYRSGHGDGVQVQVSGWVGANETSMDIRVWWDGVDVDALKTRTGNYSVRSGVSRQAFLENVFGVKFGAEVPARIRKENRFNDERDVQARLAQPVCGMYDIRFECDESSRLECLHIFSGNPDALQHIVNMGKNNKRKSISQSVEKRMQEMILPSVSFRPPATIIDAIDFFKKASMDLDRSESSVDQRGFQFMLQLDKATGGVAGNMPVIPAITATNISLWDALKLVCEACKPAYRFVVQENSVINVQPKTWTTDELMTKTFNVVEDFVDRMDDIAADLKKKRVGRVGGNGGGGDGEKSLDDFWKGVFTGLGVTWPKHAQIKYIGPLGKLRVTNTEEQLAIFEDALGKLKLIRPDVKPKVVSLKDVEPQYDRLCGNVKKWLGISSFEIKDIGEPTCPGRISSFEDGNIRVAVGMFVLNDELNMNSTTFSIQITILQP